GAEAGFPEVEQLLRRGRGDRDRAVGNDRAMVVSVAFRHDHRDPRRAFDVPEATARTGREPERVAERDERAGTGRRKTAGCRRREDAVAALLEERSQLGGAKRVLARPRADDAAARPAVARFLDLVESHGLRTARRGPARNPASTRSGMTSLSVT